MRVMFGFALSALVFACLPLSVDAGAAHARAVSAEQAKSAKTVAASARKKPSKAKRAASKKHKAKKHQAKKRSAKKRQAKKRSAKKRSAKKRTVKKRVTKKRTAKKRTAKKRTAKKRTAKKHRSAKRKAATRKSAKRKAKKRRVAKRSGRKNRAKKTRRYIAARPTLGTVFRLHQAPDPLSLRSSVAYVLEPDSQRVLFAKNSGVVLPVASITKLMTAIVVLDADQPMREMLTVTRADIDRLRGSRSRLAIGTRLSRAEMLQLALMSSANRAANALGRHYPGGLKAFVSAMNARARLFGMTDTQFADPTGLSGANVSSAKDIARLAAMANDYPLIRKYSTASGLQVDTGYKRLQFHNTNRLLSNDNWSIGLQKTGYIAEAGRCLVMVARIDGRNLVMVLLDSNGSSSRFADAGRIKRWLMKDGPGIYAATEPAAVH
ncbi:MAG: serine hydrolase [Burkholderiaceae bacterium]